MAYLSAVGLTSEYLRTSAEEKSRRAAFDRSFFRADSRRNRMPFT